MMKASRASPVHRTLGGAPPLSAGEQTRQHRACQSLGDALRKRDCEVQDLVLTECASPLHIFECLPYNTSLRSLNVEHTRKLSDDGHYRPLDATDHRFLFDCLTQRGTEAPLPLLLAPDTAFTEAQIGSLSQLGTCVIPSERLAARHPVVPAPADAAAWPAPQPPASASLPLYPSLLCSGYLNVNQVEQAGKQLTALGQTHLSLTRTHLIGVGCTGLKWLTTEYAQQLLSLDLRDCQMDRPFCVLQGIADRKVPLHTLWIDASMFPLQDQWVELIWLLKHKFVQRLVINPEGAAPGHPLHKLPAAAPLLIPSQVHIWIADQHIHPQPATSRGRPSPVAASRRAAPPRQSLVDAPAAGILVVDALRQRQMAALVRHLNTNGGLLTWPLAHLNPTDAAGLGVALCEHADALLSLDLSTCAIYEPSPSRLGWMASDKTTFARLMRALERRLTLTPGACLDALVINGNHLRKQDWVRLTARATEGAILTLRFVHTSEKTRARIRRLVDAITAANAPTQVHHD